MSNITNYKSWLMFTENHNWIRCHPPSWWACANGRLFPRAISHEDYAPLPASAPDVSCTQWSTWSQNDN